MYSTFFPATIRTSSTCYASYYDSRTLDYLKFFFFPMGGSHASVRVFDDVQYKGGGETPAVPYSGMSKEPSA